MEMTERQRRLDALIRKVIKEFNIHEKYMLENNVSERSICSKLAEYLRQAKQSTEFGKFVVDVEWNRGYAGTDSRKKCYLMPKTS